MRAPAFLKSSEFRAGASSGLLLTLASPPLPLGALGYIALVPMLELLFSPRRVVEETPLRLKTLILSFGLVHHLTQLHWLLLLGEASPLTFRWALPFILLLLAFFQTAFDAILLWLCSRLREARGAQAIWWFPGLWILVEWLRATGDMGFPWLRLAMSQIHFLPVLQLAGWVGELGISLFVVWVNVLVALSLFSLRGEYPGLGRAVLSRWWPPVALIVLFALVFSYGLLTIEQLEQRPPAREPLRIGIVQANVDLMDKWDPARRDSTFVPYTQLTQRLANDGARLVIWPETAIPMDLPRRPEYLGLVRDLVRGQEIFLLSGFPERQVDEDGSLLSYNSSFLMDDEGGIVARYRKMHLLPLGERIPFQTLIPILGKIDFGQAEWEPGPDQTIFEVDGFRFAAMICFESIFSRFSRQAVARGAGFLVNITNDGWFGNTALPHQHAWMAVMRACENRVPLLRSANNGLSFVVRPSGRVENMTELFERRAFVTDVVERPEGTFYTRHGDGPLFLILLAGTVFLLTVARVADRAPRRD